MLRFRIETGLHFDYTTRQFVQEGQKSPCDCVNKKVNQSFKKCEDLPDVYNKGDNGVFGLLESRVEIAIKNSKKALKAGEEVDTNDPATLMHVLVEYLINLKK